MVIGRREKEEVVGFLGWRVASEGTVMMNLDAAAGRVQAEKRNKRGTNLRRKSGKLRVES